MTVTALRKEDITITDLVHNFSDETMVFSDLDFIESVLDIFETMSSGNKRLDAIQPETARALLSEARLKTQKVKKILNGLGDYLEAAK